MILYKQENYNHELGTGEGYSISRFGCALLSLTVLCNLHGKDIDPLVLNLDLVAHDGFASNGTFNPDGSVNKTLLRWGMLAAIFPDIRLEKNIAFPATPADLGLIDSYLAGGNPVVAGVSFLHNPKDTVPSHYVLIYKKNDDGSYQAYDPWYGDSIRFDARYAVNGMSVAECILQVVAYAGPAVAPQPAETTAPHEAAPQQALTVEDTLRKARDDNWNLYTAEVELVKTKDDRIQELQTQVQELQDANTKLATETSNTKNLNSVLATQLSDLEAKDSAAIEEGLKAQDKLKVSDEIVHQTAEILQVQPKKRNILEGLDSLFSRIHFAKKDSVPQIKAKDPVLALLGFKGGELH